MPLTSRTMTDGFVFLGVDRAHQIDDAMPVVTFTRDASKPGMLVTSSSAVFTRGVIALSARRRQKPSGSRTSISLTTARAFESARPGVRRAVSVSVRGLADQQHVPL